MARFVKYIGTATRRIISEDDWKRQGIEAPRMVWDRATAWIQDVSILPTELQDLLLSASYFVEVNQKIAEADLIVSRQLRQPGARRTKAQRERVELPVTNGGKEKRVTRTEVPQ